MTASHKRKRYTPMDYTKPARVNAETSPLAYLVKLSHDMPSLSNIPTDKWPVYTPVLPRGTNSVPSGTIVLATIKTGRLTLTSVPASITLAQANMSYDMTAPTDATILARIHGFVIYTSPSDFFTRACAYLNANMLKDALSEFDLALTLKAASLSEISDSLERSYKRYAQLRNLALGSHEVAEAILAQSRALQYAAKTWTLMNTPTPTV